MFSGILQVRNNSLTDFVLEPSNELNNLHFEGDTGGAYRWLAQIGWILIDKEGYDTARTYG